MKDWPEKKLKKINFLFLILVAKRGPLFERKIKNSSNNYALYFKEMQKINYFGDSL